MSEMLQGMITEEELLKLLNVKPSELAHLRNEKGLPYVRFSRTRRIYLEEDLMEWFKNHRVMSDPSTYDPFKRPGKV